MLHYFWVGGRNEEKASGRQVNRSESIAGQPLSLSSCSVLPWIFPTHAHVSESCATPEFNQQLEMTAGTDGRVRSIVLVCEAGAQGGNETQKERWWGGGDR